ncbi:hypothetical protein E9993_14315 [Labilibacter sediminis]|nr:hypothetical protein E9993_14315 [Labilibacter sediminis]
MNQLSSINSNSSKENIIEEMIKVLSPYAKELLSSGADFSYMNMYADNFTDQLKTITNLSDVEIFEILNEACDTSWRNQATL